ncbi:MAG: DNA polymerase III subunit beta [Candidatus Sericytochromatia bacterium]|nr:MAG: DNA polymerase III subunit beta [Candidatus Sericytochromatia bacterium]
MHIICKRDNLLKGFQSVSKAVSSRALLPVLSNVLFEVKESKLFLKATDLEIGIETLVETEVLKEGSVTIPAVALQNILPKLPDYDVELKTNQDNSETTLKCFKSEFKLNSIPSDDFPKLPQIDENNSFFINSELLTTAIKKTIFSASTDTSKNILNGVRMVINSGNLEMAATDGYRLAVKKMFIESSGNQNLSATLPSKAMNELVKLISSSKDDTVSISQLSNQLVFKVNDKILSTRVIEGQYPDYNRIIPTNLDKHLIVDRIEFLSSIDRVSSISSEKINVVKMEISSNKVNISSSSSELGKSSEELTIEYEGENLDINFNAKFLIEALKNFDDDKVKILMRETLTPCIIKPLEDESYFCMIMPLRS